MSTYNSVQEKRKAFWFKNAIRFRLMRIFRGKRDDRLWLFSAWEGQKYADNSKYLFEYVIKYHKEITCVWQTKNKEVYDLLKQKRYNVQLIGTKESIQTQKKAGVVIYTNGLDDFGDNPYIYGAKLVSVWHGVGFKKIYRSQLPKMNKFRLFLSNYKWDFFSWTKRDLTIITSEYHKKQCLEGFHLNRKSKFYLAGQPRNDIFACDIKYDSVFLNQNIISALQGKKIILYMPTFRENNSILLEQIELLYKSEEFKKVLTENNAIFVSKLHYLCRGNIKSNECMLLLNDEDVIDTQRLLGIADILITDYSSCAIDFALLKRPIIFYFPSDGYDVKKWMMPDAMEYCSICKVSTEKECIKKIETLLNDHSEGIKQSETLNSVFNEIIDIGTYAKRTYSGICNMIKNN